MMGLSIDREKVIKGLTVHLSNKVPPCDECPYANFEDTRRYNDPRSCSLSVMADALTLLKEQEPKPVEFTNAYGTKFYFCPKCKRELFHTRNLNFCEKCGQAVKWE